MRTIAIILGDNDFGNTFLNLLETLKRVLAYHGAISDEPWRSEVKAHNTRSDRVLTQENIKFIIQQMIMPHYIAFQYSFDERNYGGTPEEHFAHLSKYLSKVKVLFDEEAEASIAEGWHDGDSWYLELLSGTVSSY